MVGVNAQIATNGVQANSGVGFAIPIDTAKDVIPELRRDGKIERAYLGVSSAEVDSDVARRLNLPQSTARWCRPWSRAARPPSRAARRASAARSRDCSTAAT